MATSALAQTMLGTSSRPCPPVHGSTVPPPVQRLPTEVTEDGQPVLVGGAVQRQVGGTPRLGRQRLGAPVGRQLVTHLSWVMAGGSTGIKTLLRAARPGQSGWEIGMRKRGNLKAVSMALLMATPPDARMIAERAKGKLHDGKARLNGVLDKNREKGWFRRGKRR
jgi:hypothetical protein